MMAWGRGMSLLQFAPSFEGAAERELIGEFEPGARRQAMSDARDRQVLAGEMPRQIEAGGVALDIRSERNNNFLNRFLLQPRIEGGDPQVFRFDPVQR